MKIVCGACGAKYSIADEKVQGKVFKIRCKKCSNVIVVKGSSDGDDAVAQGAAEWYVVVDGDQLGPVTSVEVDSYFMSGRINADTFAWRDGLPDWVPLSTLSEFGHLTAHTAGPEEATQISDGFAQMGAAVAGDGDATVSMTSKADAFADPSPSPAQESSFGVDAGGLGGGESGYSAGDFDGGFSDFGGSSSDAGGGFAAFESGSGGGGSFESFDSSGFDGGATELHSSPASGGAEGGNAGMFASFDSGGGSGQDDFLGFSSGGSAAVEPAAAPSSAAAPSPAASNGSNGSANNMIGQRNENSVLFSLSSLDQVQSVGPASSPGPSLSLGSGQDATATEGSGLIDIRALATAHSQMKDAGAAGGDSLDPFSAGTMAMPALMPMGSHRSNKPLIIGGLIAVALLFAVTAIAVTLLLTKEDTPPAPQVVEKIVVVKEPAGKEVDSKAAADAKAASEAAIERSAQPTESDTNADANPEAATKTKSKKRGKSSRTKAKAPAKAEAKPKKKTTKKKGDGIDDLLASIDSKEKKPATKKKKTPTPPTSSSGGKAKLSKNDVLGTIRRSRGRISTCYKKSNKNNLSGKMMVGFAIKPSGKVTNVKVKTGKFAGTDVGKCVVKAVKGMRFPSTSATKNQTVSYPFKLK